jgi:hypothetical protein
MEDQAKLDRVSAWNLTEFAGSEHRSFFVPQYEKSARKTLPVAHGHGLILCVAGLDEDCEGKETDDGRGNETWTERSSH